MILMMFEHFKKFQEFIKKQIPQIEQLLFVVVGGATRYHRLCEAPGRSRTGAHFFNQHI